MISKADYLIHLEKGRETTLILFISYLQSDPFTTQLVTLFTQFIKSASNNHHNYLFFFILILKKRRETVALCRSDPSALNWLFPYLLSLVNRWSAHAQTASYSALSELISKARELLTGSLLFFVTVGMDFHFTTKNIFG